MTTTKLKVYELAKELAIDPQNLVDVIQRLGVDVKNTMSVLGTEEVRTVRDHYRKQRPLSRATAAAKEKQSSQPMTEKRVGATVIRRRASATPPPVATPEVEEPQEAEETAEPTEEQVLEAQEAVETTAAETEAPVEAQSEAEEVQAVEAEAAPEASPGPSEQPPTTPSTAAPQASAPPVTPKKPEVRRRSFPSIIKKVGTEQYLGETVGPKPPERPPTPKPSASAAKKPGAPGTAAASAGTDATRGPRRVKEVEFVTPEVAKDTKRRLTEGQSTVFKRADYLKRELVHSTKKKKAVINRPALKTLITKPAEHKRVVEMGESITVAEMAKELGIKATQLIGKLMGMGVTASMNEKVDLDTATLVAQEYGYEIKQKMFREEDYLGAVDLTAEKLKPRPPVVTVMGHVDHGKTSLLDRIRKANVAAGEAGGITQHVGAYTVQIPKGRITFIDTPGHEAFTQMRARGAKVTDIVILVVSAIDGVMPQTLESVAHAKAGSVPIIVAINKMDMPDANPDRIKQTLAGHDLNPEEWGGDTIYVNVSAKTGLNVDKLLESVLLQAEMLELKANYEIPARGTVIESKLDKSRGPVATVLVQHGILKPGDQISVGFATGKVRALTNSAGQRVDKAEPGDPVEVLGLTDVPNVGDDLAVMSDEHQAKDLALQRANKKERSQVAKPRMTIEEILAAPTGGDKELRVVLKSDVQGSVEALKEALLKFPTDRVRLKVLHTGTGGITESDVMLASASKAVILGFNIRPEVKAQKLAEAEGVQLKTYSIIYELLDDVKKFLEGMLDVQVKDKVIGRAEVRSVFNIPKIGTIAGSAVIDGKVIRGCYLRLLRDSRVVYEGKISSLKRFKEDVREVQQGYECGIGLENFSDLKLGDQFEAFIKEEIKSVL